MSTDASTSSSPAACSTRLPVELVEFLCLHQMPSRSDAACELDVCRRLCRNVDALIAERWVSRVPADDGATMRDATSVGEVIAYRLRCAVAILLATKGGLGADMLDVFHAIGINTWLRETKHAAAALDAPSLLHLRALGVWMSTAPAVVGRRWGAEPGLANKSLEDAWCAAEVIREAGTDMRVEWNARWAAHQRAVGAWRSAARTYAAIIAEHDWTPSDDVRAFLERHALGVLQDFDVPPFIAPTKTLDAHLVAVGIRPTP